MKSGSRDLNEQFVSSGGTIDGDYQKSDPDFSLMRKSNLATSESGKPNKDDPVALPEDMSSYN